VITSEPSGAAVLEDGYRRLGRTPLTLERRAMTRVDLELVKKGYQTYRGRRVVEAGRTLRHHVRLRPEQGELVVRSGLIRGATILVDGEEQGRTPRRVSVTAGQPLQIEVRKWGFRPFRDTVTVKAGESRDLEADLVPWGKVDVASGWLTVRTDVPAQVKLGGSTFGTTPITRVPLPARRYRLTLSNPELGLSRTIKVRVRPGKTKELDVRLR
jgi:hypothetical protein